MKNFSIVTYNGTRYTNSSNTNIAYSFTAGADYYDAVFSSNSPNASWVHFEVTVEKPQVLFPFSTLTAPARIMFLLSLGSATIIILKLAFSKSHRKIRKKAASTDYKQNLPKSPAGSCYFIIGALALSFSGKF